LASTGNGARGAKETRHVKRSRLRDGAFRGFGKAVRALEAAGAPNGLLRAGNDVATGRIGAGTQLRIVDVVLTGAHEPGTSHHALLGAFLDAMTLSRVDAELAAKPVPNV
jgi:S-adenosylmethionine:tRNA ribosyltransferase-isomerase